MTRILNPKRPVDINKYMGWHLSHHVVTSHPVFGDVDAVIANLGGSEIITGIETALAWWQIYRTRKDWKSADRIRRLINELGYHPAFLRDRYEAHERYWDYRANPGILDEQEDVKPADPKPKP